MNLIPKIASITVNRACNFRCKWCYAKGTQFNDKKTLTIDLAIRLLDIVKELNIKRIIIIGGEPTLWEPLPYFNSLCQKLNIKTSMVTNAYRFGDDDYWNQYIKNPNDRVEVSIKAFDDHSSLELTGIKNFSFLKKGLSRAIDRFGSGVSFVCSSFVTKDLVSLAKVAYSCGAKKILISPCTPSLSDGKIDTIGMIPLQDLVINFMSQYDELNTLFAGKLTFTIKTPLCIWPMDFIEKLIERRQLQTTCQFQHRSGIIFDPEGQVLGCNRMVDYPLGNIDVDYTDAKSLISLFNSDEVVSCYNYINSYPSELCIGCSQEELCRGGCPLMWTVYNAKETIFGWNKKKGGNIE